MSNLGTRQHPITDPETALQNRGSKPNLGTLTGETDVRAFRDALGTFATGVTIVTCKAQDGQPIGITANSFASLSLDPPLILWSPAKASRRHVHYHEAETFALHVLSDDQQDLCARFAQSGDDFEGLDFHQTDKGVPLLNGCLARFECRTQSRFDGGDHTIIVGHVTHVSRNPGAPLCFSAGKFGRFMAGN